MKHKVIHTESYLLVVDESDIKDDVWHLDNGVIKKWKGNLHSNRLTSKKIIAHLPLNNSPILQGVDLLPPLEDDVEQLAKEYANSTSDIDVPYTNGLFYGFIEGYNKFKAKYKYTEEDLSKALSYGYHTAKDEAKGIPSSGYFTRFIQSLQQPKCPVGFECEIWYNEFVGKRTIKTTTNSQGLTQWVGRYIYE